AVRASPRTGRDGGSRGLLRVPRPGSAEPGRGAGDRAGPRPASLDGGDGPHLDRHRRPAGRPRPSFGEAPRAAPGRGIVDTAALVLGSLFATLLVLEAVLRLMHYEPTRFRNTARVVDSKWRALLDCYPTNPRGYFDIDLRDPATRERYRWM